MKMTPYMILLLLLLAFAIGYMLGSNSTKKYLTKDSKKYLKGKILDLPENFTNPEMYSPLEATIIGDTVFLKFVQIEDYFKDSSALACKLEPIYSIKGRPFIRVTPNCNDLYMPNSMVVGYRDGGGITTGSHNTIIGWRELYDTQTKNNK